jgi:hypothetical protein
MPLYRYTDTLERYYPDRALTVRQGDDADWPEPPDPYWTAVGLIPSPTLAVSAEPQESDA